MRQTIFGWALESDKPIRNDLFWIPTGTDHVYTFDGEGWFRILPPERMKHPEKDLPHG